MISFSFRLEPEATILVEVAGDNHKPPRIVKDLVVLQVTVAVSTVSGLRSPVYGDRRPQSEDRVLACLSRSCVTSQRAGEVVLEGIHDAGPVEVVGIRGSEGKGVEEHPVDAAKSSADSTSG